VAVLAKSIGGFLPLLLAPFHALLAGRLYLPWRKQSLRWLYWSPLLLVPLAWWGFLIWQYGTEVISSIVSNFEDEAPSHMPRLYQFFKTYVLEFGLSYIFWLPFALIGSRMAWREAFDAKTEKGKRAISGLLLGWTVIVFVSSGLKPAHHERYLMPALPAISLLAALGVMRVLRGRFPVWIPGAMAAMTIAAAIGMTCLPVRAQFGELNLMPSMAAILNRRLLPHSRVPVIQVKTDAQGNAQKSWADNGRSRFFLGRDAHLTTLEEARAAAARGRFTAIVPRKDYARVARELKLDPLIETSFWVLAEIGSANDDTFGRPHASDEANDPAYSFGEK
jgi:hypothetical protein